MAIRTISHVIFLLRKILEHKKCKANNFTLLKVFVREQLLLFVLFYFLIFVLLVGFCLFCIFYAAGFFFKKRPEIILIASFTLPLTMLPRK